MSILKKKCTNSKNLIFIKIIHYIYTFGMPL